MSEPSTASPSMLTTVRRHLVLITVGTLAGLMLGLLIAAMLPRTYTAESRVFLSSQASFVAVPDGSFGNDPKRYLDQQAMVMMSGPMLTRAIALGAAGPGVEELQNAVDVIASAESDVVTVRASGDSPEEATARVDKIIAAYREYQKSLVTRQLSAIDSVSNANERRLAKQRAAVFGDGVALVEQASLTTKSSAIRDATVLALVGLLMSFAVAFVLDSRAGRREGRGELPRGQTAPGSPRRGAGAQLGVPGWDASPDQDGGADMATVTYSGQNLPRDVEKAGTRGSRRT